MFNERSNFKDKVSSTLYDLTHLEINTIIKEEMDASKAPSSPRLLLHSLATKFHQKLVSMGEEFEKDLGPSKDGAKNLFRGKEEFSGSGYTSFLEFSERANNAIKAIEEGRTKIQMPKDKIEADIKMLQRIETISNDIRRILVIQGVDPFKDGTTFNFDIKKTIEEFRTMSSRNAEKYELKLDLRQYLVIKKANDIGTEKVVLQTIIGMDGDITTRISKTFAEQPISFINEIHQKAISISVDFWKTLINVVVELGKSFIAFFTGKG